MLSNSAASIARNGIMFATTGDPDSPFPSISRGADDPAGTPGAHEHLPYGLDPADFGGWMLVSIDPRGFTYYDEANEALDKSNWSVVEGALGEYHECAYYNFGDEDYDEAIKCGALVIDRIVLVAPLADLDRDEDEASEHGDRVERLADLSNSLADYPILDEDDYSGRESDAWDAWASDGGLEMDTIRDLRDAGADESVLDAISESWSEVWPAAMQYTHYYDGFTGECGPDFHECVMEALARGTIRALVGLSTLAY